MQKENRSAYVSVRMTQYEADRLDRIARRLSWSRSQLMRELFLRFEQKHHDPVKELQKQ